ncbi:InlB B-repeat-containing protein [Metabacillus malikii]|uniref:Tetratricopeptide (TPR) repeat protein n=1 Tax=Metabacillus malikii TaxID=1504265 RepID=A0ABT9ZJR6_9BACI|nr:carboxypeptidase regulatory-like domain-containing protein [Metabacillus malikii]MDQ0231470.1 tetratricopeptide (TPR) repeat protein [Metabacillus malikii]
MSEKTRKVLTKRNITIFSILAIILLSLGTYFTIQYVNAETIKEQLALGDRYYQEQKYEEAIIAYETVLEIDEENVEARIGLAKSYQALEKVEEAKEVLTAGIKVVPKEPSFYLELSNMQIIQKDIVGAVETLDDGIRNTKDDRLKNELSTIDSQIELVSDRKEVQVEKTAQLKLVYINKNEQATETEEEANKADSEESSETQAKDADSEESTEEQTESQDETADSPEQSELNTDAEDTETNDDSTSTEETQEEEDQTKSEVLVEGKWSLTPGESGQLQDEIASTNVFTANSPGRETVVATIGSLEKQATLTVKEHVLENIEIVASVNKNTVGNGIELKAIGQDANGEEMEVSPDWSILEGVGTLALETGATNTFLSNEPGNSTIVARIEDKEFKISLETIEQTFNLNKEVSGQGSIVTSAAGTQFKDGQNVSLKAIPAEGWEFVGWEGSVDGTADQVSVVMDTDKAVRALFKPQTKYYTLQVNSEGSGAVTKSIKANKYREGTILTLTASPQFGWEFSHWKGSISSKNAQVQVTMNGSKDIVAVFVKKADTAKPVKKPAAKPFQKPAQQTSEPKPVQPEPTPTPQPEQEQPAKPEAEVLGNLGGIIKNARTGEVIPGALVKLREGVDTQSGEVIQSGSTAQDGNYSLIGISPGNYTLEVAKDGFSTKYVAVEVGVGERKVKNETLMPIEKPTETTDFQVVLTWGPTPYDLDAHLTGPTVEQEGRFHVSYRNDNYVAPDGTVYAQLDTDDQDGDGPETITTFKQTDGVYRYFVHNFSGEPSITTSEAKVELYQNGVLKQVFNVPTTGTGQYWNVFEIENGQVRVKNQLLANEPE